MTWVTIPQTLPGGEALGFFGPGVTQNAGEEHEKNEFQEEENFRNDYGSSNLHTYGDCVIPKELPWHNYQALKVFFFPVFFFFFTPLKYLSAGALGNKPSASLLIYGLSTHIPHPRWALTTSGRSLPWTHRGEWSCSASLSWGPVNEHMWPTGGLTRKQDPDNGQSGSDPCSPRVDLTPWARQIPADGQSSQTSVSLLLRVFMVSASSPFAFHVESFFLFWICVYFCCDGRRWS